MKPPFFLVPDEVSNNTIDCLKLLLYQAKRGDVIGIAYTAMLRQRSYITNTAGECYRNPTFTRGMVAALDDQLSTRIRGGNP